MKILHHYHIKQCWLTYPLILALFLQSCSDGCIISSTSPISENPITNNALPAKAKKRKKHKAKIIQSADREDYPLKLKQELSTSLLPTSLSTKNKITRTIEKPEQVLTVHNKASKETEHKEREKEIEKAALKKVAMPSPQITHFDPNSYLKKEKVNSLIKEAIELKLVSSNIQDAINNLVKAAESKHGAIQAMYHLGLICEENEAWEQAVKWYVLSFQESWLQDAAKSYYSLAYKGLKRLAEKGIGVAAKICLLHSFDMRSPEERYSRYRALIDFYKKGTAEPYFNNQENKMKIDRLEREAASVFGKDKSRLQGYNKIGPMINQGMTFMLNADYKNAENIFFKYLYIPQALFGIGVLYEEGRISELCGQPDYQKAADYYKKSGTNVSFCNLGRLYQDGLIGKIGEKADYQTAIKYFELSGLPEALCNLGIIAIRENYNNEKFDYQRVIEYFEQSNTWEAHLNLGNLYLQGRVGMYVPQPDYEKAKEHYEVSIKKGCPATCDVWFLLGALYLEGYVGKTQDQVNYELAVRYLKEATKTPDAHLRHTVFGMLGASYLQGDFGSKQGELDYQTAKDYFEQAITNSPTILGKVTGFSSLLYVYQLGSLKLNTLEDQQQVINQITHSINTLLPFISDSELYRCKGISELYNGNWEKALVSFQKALTLGNDDEEIIEQIEVIVDYLERKAKATSLLSIEKQDKVSSTTSISELSIIEEDNAKLETEVVEPFKKVSLMNSVEYVEYKDIEVKKVSPALKLTKEQKQILKEQRSKKQVLKSYHNKSKFLLHSGNQLATPQPPPSIEFEFLSEQSKIEFEECKQENNKIQELLEDIKVGKWTTSGSGKPEVLKYAFRGYKGCISRRINKEARIVYKVLGKGKILIIDWQGHY